MPRFWGPRPWRRRKDMSAPVTKLVAELEKLRDEVVAAEDCDDLSGIQARCDQLVREAHDTIDEWGKALDRVIHARREALRRVA